MAQEALPEFRDRAGGPLGNPAVIRRPSWRSGTRHDGSGGPLIGVGRVERPFLRSGMGWEVLLEVRDRLEGPVGGL